MKPIKQQKLVIITSTFPRWRGDSVPRFVLEHAKQFVGYFRDVLVIAPHYKQAKYLENLEGVNVRRFTYWLPVSGENIVYDGHAAKKVKKTPLYALKLMTFVLAQWLSTVKNGQKAVVNAHWLVPQGFIAILARPFNRSRVVITIHGSDVFTLNSRLLRKIKTFTLKKADAVVVNSSATKSACEKFYRGRQYPIIPMGVDIEKIAQTKSSREVKPFTMIFVGRLSREKGVQYLLEAVKKVKDKSLKLKIIGDGPEAENLKKYVVQNSLGTNVDFLGWVQPNKLPEHLQSASIFVGPSVIDEDGSQEALGLVFIEAAAAGLPVIATDTGGIKDVVIDGQTGFLVEQKNTDQLVEKILQLKNNKSLRTRMGKQALKQAKNFSWENTKEQYKALFESVINRQY